MLDMADLDLFWLELVRVSGVDGGGGGGGGVDHCDGAQDGLVWMLLLLSVGGR